ncbi:hypothetical protein LZ31DRAFT_271870 [Colletotrichum somersetense]|nr:hypothetical protein LZ31DRAFT_271870 [Colletotrichum somersetense]
MIAGLLASLAANSGRSRARTLRRPWFTPGNVGGGAHTAKVTRLLLLDYRVMWFTQHARPPCRHDTVRSAKRYDVRGQGALTLRNGDIRRQQSAMKRQCWNRFGLRLLGPSSWARSC